MWRDLELEFLEQSNNVVVCLNFLEAKLWIFVDLTLSILCFMQDNSRLTFLLIARRLTSFSSMMLQIFWRTELSDLVMDATRLSRTSLTCFILATDMIRVTLTFTGLLHLIYSRLATKSLLITCLCEQVVANSRTYIASTADWLV